MPAEAVYGPYWRTGKAIPTRFTHADGEALGIAGLWAPWRNPLGEWELSFTMLTINADRQPLFKEMHRPDLSRPVEKQDKRMAVILPEAQYEEWLDAPAERSIAFMNQTQRLVMTPAPLPPKEPKPKPTRAQPKVSRPRRSRRCSNRPAICAECCVPAVTDEERSYDQTSRQLEASGDKTSGALRRG